MPAENSSTGRSSSATTSRMMCTDSASSSRSSSTCGCRRRVGGRHVGRPSFSASAAVAIHPVVGALIGLAFQHRLRRQPRIEPERLEDRTDHLGEVAPQHGIRNVDRLDVSPRRTRSASLPPARAASRRRGRWRPRGTRRGHRGPDPAGPARPGSAPPARTTPPARRRRGGRRGRGRDRSRRRRGSPTAGRSPERSGRPSARSQQQRRLVPHQLAAPDAVRRAADGADVVAPDLRRGEVGLALVEGVEQAQDRFVLDALEPLPRLRRLAGGRQVLEELLRLAGDARARAATRRAACCRCAARRAPDTPTGSSCARA